MTLRLSEKNNSTFMNAEDLSVLASNTGNAAVAYSAEISGKAGYEGKYKQVLITASNENIFDYYPFRMIKGNFLTEWHCKKGSRVAVISKNLAVRLFMSCDILGYSIFIDGSMYRIAGVYDEIVTPVTLFSLDDMERVFIPLASNYEYTGIPISSILISGDADEGYSFGYFIRYMGKKYYSKLLAYNIRDYSRSSEFILQIVRLVFFIIGLSLLFLLLFSLIFIIKAFYLHIKKILADNYLPEILKEQKSIILLFVIKVVIIIAGMLAIYSVVHFTPFLPEKYIPEDNIFDLGFYFKKFMEYIRQENDHNLTTTIFNLSFKTSLTYILVFSLLIFIQWIKLFRRIMKFIGNRTKNKTFEIEVKSCLYKSV